MKKKVISYTPSRRLIRAIKIAEKEYASGNLKVYKNVEELIAALNS